MALFRFKGSVAVRVIWCATCADWDTLAASVLRGRSALQRSVPTGLLPKGLHDGFPPLLPSLPTSQLQFLYLLLGRPPHAAEWREALTQLRTDYESMYKYSGKV